MKRAPDRRAVLRAAAAAILAVAGAVPASLAGAAPGTKIRGAVGFEGGAVIPAGRIEIYLQDPASATSSPDRAAGTRIGSDGKSTTLAFSIDLTDIPAPSPTRQIVARLERADGWLIARGSTKFEAGSPVRITLNAALY